MAETFPSLETPEAEKPRELSPVQKELLELVDFPLLQTLFEERIRKSGGNVAGLLRIGKDDIRRSPRRDEDEGKLGGWDAPHHVLYISDPSQFRVALHEQLSKEKIYALQLQALCHEMTHAYSPHLHEESENRIEDRSGIDAVFKEPGKRARRFMDVLNEGITDTIAEKVFNEYARRKGIASLKSHEGRIHVFQKQYALGRKIFDHLSKVVAAECGVSYDVARKGFERAYFTGFHFDSPEFATLVNETIDPTFYATMTKLGTTSVVPFFAWRHLIIKPWTDELRTRWAQALTRA